MKKFVWMLIILFPIVFTGCGDDDKAWDPEKFVEVNLDYETPFYHFNKGLFKRNNLPENEIAMGLYNEPWCTDLPALCGSYEVTESSSFASLSEAPIGDYEEDCSELPLNKVIVFKLNDGTYALVKIVSDVYNMVEGEYCEHKITLHVNYPAF